jgi:hypothetical protein
MKSLREVKMFSNGQLDCLQPMPTQGEVLAFGQGIVYCGVVYCIVALRGHCIVIVAHGLLLLFTSLRILFPMGLTH